MMAGKTSDMKQLYCKIVEQWREWLQQLIMSQRVRSRGMLCRDKFIEVITDYDGALDEALCYGWVDSVIKKLDEQRYARKFTPR